MKTQTVHENISFKRGRDPKQVLGIGKKAQIDNWFKKWAPGVEYEIDDNLNIYVDGYLDLDITDVTSLPDNLKIGRSLFLKNTKITSLPDNLKVGEDLNLTNTKITSLPDDLEVKGEIYT